MLLGPVALLFFKLLIVDFISCGYVGVKKKESIEGLSKKSWYFVLVGIILLSIFCAIVEKNLLKVFAIKILSVSSVPIISIQLIVFLFFFDILINWI